MYVVPLVGAWTLLMLMYMVVFPAKLYGEPSDLIIEPPLTAIWLLEVPS